VSPSPQTRVDRRPAPLRSVPTAVLLVPVLGLLVAAGPGASVAAAQRRGYQPRACGLDMNRNGIPGEPAGADPLVDPGDCNVCDGGPSHPTHPDTGTPDPDGDGVFEDLIYVDGDLGSDATGDGTALAPYRTLAHAWSMADGPGDGAEDILCFRGVTTESSISPPSDFTGVPGTYAVPANGSQGRDWHFPSNPTMLVGWDYDDDGCYPPYDDGIRDTAHCGTNGGQAVLNGNFASSIRAFHLAPNVSYFEVAHLKIRDYGRLVADTNSGFLKFWNASNHQYVDFHDLELLRINGGRSSDSSIIAIDVFSTNFHWVSFRNLLFDRNGGWFLRGSPHQGEDGQSDAGPLRIQNVTRIMLGSENGATTGFKPWGYLTGVEVLDSIWDMNLGEWTPLPGSGNATFAFNISQCTQDWLIRNNEVIDFWQALRLNGSADGFCENEVARPVQDVVIDRNIFRNTYDLWDWGHAGVSITGDDPGSTEGDAPGEVVGSVTVSNNFISSSAPVGKLESCIVANAGNDAAPVPGTVTIVNNTCSGAIRRDEGAAILIGAAVDSHDPQNFMQQSFVVRNNVVTDLAPDDHNVILGYVPAAWVSNHNVYDADGRYALWVGNNLNGVGNLGSWRPVAGSDGASVECEPDFVDRASGDFHLLPSDDCARGAGLNLGAANPHDVDGYPRPETGPWDAGADDPIWVFADGFESGDLSRWSSSSF